MHTYMWIVQLAKIGNEALSLTRKVLRIAFMLSIRILIIHLDSYTNVYICVYDLVGLIIRWLADIQRTIVELLTNS